MTIELVSVGVVCADVMVRPVDVLPNRGALGLAPMLEMHLGGLAAVTGIVYSQLGGKASFIGRLGCDGFGDFLLAALQRNNVDVSGLKRVDDARSSATVVLIDSAGERTFLHHVGANAETCAADIVLDQFPGAKALHWGGPAIMPRLDGTPMGEVFQQARARGLKTSMDTCYDGKGVWLPLIEPSLPHLDIIFSSIEEARKYTGCSSPEEIADFYLRYGIETAVIKLGAEGLFVKQGNSVFSIPAHTVPVVDTTGAGDASCGGFLYGYLRGWELERCARLANAVGGLTVQHMGGAEAIQGLEQTILFMETLS